MKNKLFYTLLVAILLFNNNISAQASKIQKENEKPKKEEKKKAANPAPKKDTTKGDKKETAALAKDTTKGDKKDTTKGDKKETAKEGTPDKAAEVKAKEAAQTKNYLFGGVGALLGAILGFLISFFMTKRTKKETPIGENELAESQKRIAALEVQLQEQATEIQRLTTENTALRQAQTKADVVTPIQQPAQQRAAQQQAPATVAHVFYTRTLNGNAFNMLDLRPTPDLFKVTLQIDAQENIVSGVFEVNQNYGYYEFFPSYNFMLQGCDFIGGIIPNTQSRIQRQNAGRLTPAQNGNLTIANKTQIWLK